MTMYCYLLEDKPMKLCKLLIIHLLASGASLSIGADDPAIVQEVLAARLESLQNLTVKYSYTHKNSLPSGLRERMLQKSEKTAVIGRGGFLATGINTSQKEFSFLEGRARYDSWLKERRLDREPPVPLRDNEFEVVSCPGDRVERLWRLEGSKVHSGSISHPKTSITYNDIELGLGMKSWRQDNWLTPADLRVMAVSLPDDDLAILRRVDDKGRTDEWTFDRRLGYALTSYRRLFPPENLPNFEVTAEKFKNVNGLMLPFLVVSRMHYRENGQSQVTDEVRIEVHEYRLNDANNVPERYHIKWPDNTILFDERSGVISEFENGVVRLRDWVYKDALGDMENSLSESVAKPGGQKVSVFIPNADAALQEGKAFVFSLAGRDLVNCEAKPDCQEAYKMLMELGKGDIAWNGSLLTVRKAKALTPAQESHRPLKCTPGRWCNCDALPEKVDLPYSLLVVTNEDVDYLIQVVKIEPEGITITYRKLPSEQVEGYLPTPSRSTN